MSEHVEARAVQHVAALARLALSDADAERLAHELGDILAHLEVLQTIATPPALHDGDAPTPLRDDTTGVPAALAHPLGSIAPLMREGFFLVPRLASHDGEPGA